MPPKRKAAEVAEESIKATKSTKESTASSSSSSSSSKGLDDGWIENDTLLIYCKDSEKKKEGSTKILGFDIDDTIITTKSGKTFATGSTDWMFWNDAVPEVLEKKHKEGYRIVFFSNQSGISKGKVTPKGFMSKLNSVMDSLPFPVTLLAATGSDKYRKPSVGMWKYFCKELNRDVNVDLKQSMYIGDAAGRQKDWEKGKKKDFSDSDRKFAMNLGIKFETPEEFFLGKKPVPFELNGTDPKTMKRNGPLLDPPKSKIVSDKQEIVIMVGYPGSGKSTFSKREFEDKGYVRVNRDTLGTWQKCVKVAEQALDEGKSVVVDNTNPDVETRSRYTALAKARKIQTRAFVMQTTMDEAMHNNYYREIVTDGASEHVPRMVFYTFRKNFVEPSAKEGFNEVIKVNFIPQFNSPEEEELFYLWTPLPE